MVEVRLHGALAEQFGRVWNLDILSPAEAVRAIECGRPGFRKAIMDLDRKGMVFRVRSKNHDYNDDDVQTHLGSVKRIDIIPIVRGASAGVRFVVGATLTAIGLYTGNNFLISAGVSLMLGAVTEWLTPKIKQEDVKNVNSWSFSGPVNPVDQGLPVPIVYGEVLAGSVPISAGIIVADLAPDESVAPYVAIGGTLDTTVWSNGFGAKTVKVRFGASTFNIADPMTYAWSYTGFAGSTAVRLIGSNKASLTLEVDFAGDVFLTVTGSLSVAVNGKSSDGQNNDVSASRTETVTVTLEPEPYIGSEG